MDLTAEDIKILNREVLLGFWKVHILHHAVQGPLVGQWMLTELRRHGYEVSPGTLYPMLQRMEANGWLRSEVDPQRGPKAARKYYLTAKGCEILTYIGGQAEELVRELKEESHRDLC